MPDITLTANHAKSEKLNAAWNVFRTAHGMSFSQNQGGVYFDSGLADGLWQEPNSGIIIIKPGFFTAQRFEFAIVTNTWLGPGDLTYAGTAAGGKLFSYNGSTSNGATTAYQAHSPKLQNGTDVRLGLVAIDSKLTTFIGRSEYTAQNFKWCVQSNVQLAANQGWCMIITPNGLSTDFTNSYFMVAWGQKFIIEITMAGFAFLFGDLDGTGNYVQIDTYVLKDGGVNMNQAFQISVLPIGKRFLSVSFTQHAANRGHARAQAYASQPISFLTVLQGQGPLSTDANNLEPVWSAELNQFVKYPAAPLTIGLVSNDFDYNFSIGKAYYPDAKTVYMSKLHPPAKPTWNGTIGIDPYVFSIEGQREAPTTTPTSIVPVLYDQNGTPYTAASGNALISALTLFPSKNGIYTPELHGYGVSYPANVHTPSWTPIDLSDKWTLIRFIRSCDLNAQRVECKLLEDDQYLKLMKMYGPMRLSAVDNSGNTVVLSDFYQERKQPTVEGPAQLITDQGEFLDMWDRLNSSPLLIQSVLEGDVVAEQFKTAIMSAGFLDSEVFIDYAACPELHSLTFGKITNPNDILRPNSDSSVGDFIRNTAEKIGVQFSPPFRVRWVSDGAGGMRWRIYIGPIYGARTNFTHGKVQHRLFLDDTFVSTAIYGSDQNRWAAHDFTVQSAPELTVNRPDFNAIIASAAKGVDGKEGAECRYIPPPSRVLADPTYIGFEGAERIKQLATEDLQIAQTGSSVEVIARQYYEQNYNLKRYRLLEGSCEWQPEIDADDFFVVIGAARDDDPGGRYLQGDPVSYGAFRFEHLDIEMRHDFTVDGNSSVRWEWAASFTAVYVGPYEDALFTVNGVSVPLAMWTTAANLPDNYDLPAGFTP